MQAMTHNTKLQHHQVADKLLMQPAHVLMSMTSAVLSSSKRQACTWRQVYVADYMCSAWEDKLTMKHLICALLNGWETEQWLCQQQAAVL